METMSSRTFTLDEAQKLLPVLESLLKQAIHSKTLIEEVDAEMQETAHRIFMNGGTLVNVIHLAKRSKVEGEIVLLCWKLGEAKIAFWHDTTSGFAGRKPIDERIVNAGKKRAT